MSCASKISADLTETALFPRESINNKQLQNNSLRKVPLKEVSSAFIHVPVDPQSSFKVNFNMKTFKAPDKWQICRAIAVVVTVITIATLIYCIIAEIERLIGSSDALPMAIKPTKTAAVKQSE